MAAVSRSWRTDLASEPDICVGFFRNILVPARYKSQRPLAYNGPNGCSTKPTSRWRRSQCPRALAACGGSMPCSLKSTDGRRPKSASALSGVQSGGPWRQSAKLKDHAHGRSLELLMSGAARKFLGPRNSRAQKFSDPEFAAQKFSGPTTTAIGEWTIGFEWRVPTEAALPPLAQPRHHSLNHDPHTNAVMMPAHAAPAMCGDSCASQAPMTPAR
jgi:hypothetical protein